MKKHDLMKSYPFLQINFKYKQFFLDIYMHLFVLYIYIYD